MTQSGMGLYGPGMHDFVLRELEVGFRVAAAEDSEACGMGPIIDALLAVHGLGLVDELDDLWA